MLMTQAFAGHYQVQLACIGFDYNFMLGVRGEHLVWFNGGGGEESVKEGLLVLVMSYFQFQFTRSLHV